MIVNQVVETEEGTVTFQGELTDAELEAVVSVGLNVLLKTGSLVRLEGPPDDISVN